MQSAMHAKRVMLIAIPMARSIHATSQRASQRIATSTAFQIHATSRRAWRKTATPTPSQIHATSQTVAVWTPMAMANQTSVRHPP